MKRCFTDFHFGVSLLGGLFVICNLNSAEYQGPRGSIVSGTRGEGYTVSTPYTTGSGQVGYGYTLYNPNVTISNTGRTISDQNGVYTITNPGWTATTTSGGTLSNSPRTVYIQPGQGYEVSSSGWEIAYPNRNSRSSSGWTATGQLGDGFTATSNPYNNDGYIDYSEYGKSAPGWTATGQLGQGYTVQGNGWDAAAPVGMISSNPELGNTGWTVSGQLGSGFNMYNPGWTAHYYTSNSSPSWTASAQAGQGYAIYNSEGVLVASGQALGPNKGYTIYDINGTSGTGQAGQGYSVTQSGGWSAQGEVGDGYTAYYYGTPAHPDGR